MKKLQRAILLATLADKLYQKGSWCGETHLQKTVYFLQELLGVSMEFDFVLYKHGPFSFDLRDELTSMRADGLLKLYPRPYPYGPSLVSTALSEKLRDLFPKTLNRYKKHLHFVAEQFGNKGIAELEQLATALYIDRQGKAGDTPEEWSRRIHELKPHISINEGKYAIETLNKIMRESHSLQEA